MRLCEFATFASLIEHGLEKEKSREMLGDIFPQPLVFKVAKLANSPFQVQRDARFATGLTHWHELQQLQGGKRSCTGRAGSPTAKRRRPQKKGPVFHDLDLRIYDMPTIGTTRMEAHA